MGFSLKKLSIKSVVNAVKHVAAVVNPVATIATIVSVPLLKNLSQSVLGLAGQLATTIAPPFLPQSNIMSGEWDEFDRRIADANRVVYEAQPIGSPDKLEDRLLRTIDQVDSRMNSLAARMDDPNLSMGQLARIQNDLARLTAMFEMASQTLAKKSSIDEHTIQRMR